MEYSNLLEYWLDAEYWELPVFPGEDQLKTECIITALKEKYNREFFKNNKKSKPTPAVKLFFGKHHANYAVSGHRRNERNTPISYFASILIYWNSIDDLNNNKPANISNDHIYINRAALLHRQLDMNDRASIPNRNDVKDIESKIRVIFSVCLNKYLENEAVSLTSLNYYLTSINDEIIELIFEDYPNDFNNQEDAGERFQIQPFHIKPEWRKLILWNFASINDNPDQFGPFYQRDLEMIIKDLPAAVHVKTYLQSCHPRPIQVGYKEENLKNSKLYLQAADIPFGRWPVNPEYGLVLMQYMAEQAFKNSEYLQAVNGPPGTGKTTLLKDFIADTFVTRINKMCEKLKSKYDVQILLTKNKNTNTFTVQDAIDYSIVVASSNNSAVENISRELPKIDEQIIKFYPNIEYFRTLAGAYSESRWGLFCAILGNSTNKRNFFDNKPRVNTEGTTEEYVPGDFARLVEYLQCLDDPAMINKFWEKIAVIYNADLADKTIKIESLIKDWSNVGKLDLLTKELRQLRDTTIEETCYYFLSLPKDELEKIKKTSIARMQAQKHAVRKNRALKLKKAVTDFLTLKQNFDNCINTCTVVEQYVCKLKDSEQQITQKKEEICQLEKANLLLKNEMAPFLNSANALAKRIADYAVDIAAMKANPPYVSWWRKLLNLMPAQYIKHIDTINQLVLDRTKLKEDFRTVTTKLSYIKESLCINEAAITTTLNTVCLLQIDIENMHGQIAIISEEYELDDSKHLYAGYGWNDLEEQLQKKMPWGSKYINELRTALFIAALRVNEAIVENLGGQCINFLKQFREMIQSKTQQNRNPNDINTEGRTALWSWFYLCFPVLSTTCASVGTLLASVGRQTFGYLLLDEAGQALPYAPLGLIYRVKKAIFVGDPLQLTPISTIPDDVDAKLIEKRIPTGLANDMLSRYLASSGSAQVLADHASLLQGQINDTIVGIPLRVHRRCHDPMFTFSNSTTYGDQMFLGIEKKPKNRTQHKFYTQWIQVEAEVTIRVGRYWNEGELDQIEGVITEILAIENEKLRNKLLPVYIITPFSIMATKIKERLKKLKINPALIQAGTVHTFQGKEASTVILSLVCDPKFTAQKGATWVNKTPNLLNVAVTRARENLIVIGNREAWYGGCYSSKLISIVDDYQESIGLKRAFSSALVEN